MEPQRRRMVQCLAVVDIDPSLTPLDVAQQKWITSLELIDYPSKQKSHFKCLTIIPGLYLLIGFCEANKSPIYEIDFLSKPNPDWTPVKINSSLAEHMGATLCFKTQEQDNLGPLSDIEMLPVERKSRFGEAKEVINVPSGYKLISHQLPYAYLVYRKVRSKLQRTFRPILTEKYPENITKVNLSQLPLFCFPEGIKLSRQIRGFSTFNFVFTLENGSRIYVNVLIFKQNLSQVHRKRLSLLTEENIFYQKAFCLLSQFCYTDQFSDCLQRLYRLSMSKNNVPFWKVVENFVENFNYPSEIGKFGLTYEYGGAEIAFETNESYPFITERGLYTIFKFLTVDHIINIFQALLLEKKIFFVSQSRTILGYTAEAFLSLLFPFRWEQVLIPVLPPSLREYMHAPVPLIAGISPSLVDATIQNESLIVYLDRNQVLNDQDLPPLPEKLLKQLKKRLQKIEVYDEEEVQQFLENPESTYFFKMQEVQDPHFHGDEVRDIFLEFLLTLMKNYRKYWNPVKDKEKHGQSSFLDFTQSQSMTDILRVQDFLTDLGMTKIGSFGVKFTESSIFTAFIERRQKNPNDPHIQFFDSCLERRKGKKQSTFIIEVKNQNYEKLAGPEPVQQEKIYTYEKFPSILQQEKKQIFEEEQEIKNQQDQLIKLRQIVEQEYFLNSELYEFFGEQMQDQTHRKMLNLLLSRNRNIFPSDNCENKLKVYNWWMETYLIQTKQIDEVFQNWPDVSHTSLFRPMSKKQYFVNGIKPRQNELIGVVEYGDFQILAKGQAKFLLTVGAGKHLVKQTGGDSIIFSSHRIKSFLNTLIPKQASYFFQYCEIRTAHQMRKSSFRHQNSQVWTIETLIDFRNWLLMKDSNDTSSTTENH